MPAWTPFADWMEFSHLDGGGGIEKAFTIAYKITDDSTELWSERFSRLKNKEHQAFAGGACVLRTAVPPLLLALRLKPADVVFIPALSSGETKATATAYIPALARLCAGKAGARFELNALSKQAHRPIHSLSNAAAREAELDKANYVAQDVRAAAVLVFDDFITRGSTLSRIAGAIHAVSLKAKVYAVALGKTERVKYCPNPTNDQVSKTWDELWKEGERRYHEHKTKGKP